MAYRKQLFKNGQVLKAEHLNYMEAGLKDMSDAISELEVDRVPQSRIMDIIDEYFIENPIDPKIEEAVRAEVIEYFNNNPIDVVTDDELKIIVEKYLTDHPVSGTITQEDLAIAINDYFKNNPITGGSGGGQLPTEYHANVFTTSKKIQKYENGDTSLDYFVRARGSSIWWYYGECDGGTEILDGIYWVDAEHTALTASQTNYPVTVYTYTEHIRMQVEVTEDDTHGPKWTFGSGGGYDNPDWGKAFLEKTAELMKFYLLNDAGKEIGFDIGNNYVDINGLRKPTNIDFTNTGFTVTMDGGNVMQYTYTINSSGYITAITDLYGHVTNITYPEAN